MTLIQKIKDRRARIAVVGLGYVGLPLAVEKAKAGFDVIGIERMANRRDMVNAGKNYIGDICDDELRGVVGARKLQATDDFSVIDGCDAVAICVPTPLTPNRDPDISYIVAVSEEIAKHMHKDMLVVLESTTYPGTTEEIVLPLLAKSGLKVGKDFFLAFSPERVDPGNKVFKTKNTPKVVGGVTARCSEVARALYESIITNVHTVSSPRIAEMEKLLENIFRHVNIALVNELAVLFEKMGLDVWEVIDAAGTKPYGFMQFWPGPGLGGHCIPIDPIYLSWKAKQFDFTTRFIDLAAEINSRMPYHIVDLVTSALSLHEKALKNAMVLVLGVAYKRDISDDRESPAIKIMELLEARGVRVVYHDPLVPKFKRAGKTVDSIPLDERTLQAADAVLIATDHGAFDYEWICEHAKLVVDTRNATRDVKHGRGKIVRLGAAVES